MDNQQLLDKALEELNKDAPLRDRKDIPKGGMNDFLNQITRKFFEERIKDFPNLCVETRRVNWMHIKELEQVGHKTPTRYIAGKTYEGTSGWSKDREFKHKWIVPNQLKFFMRNLIYVDFWDDKNAKIRDKFMKGILRGDDPMTLLLWVRGQYGQNSLTVEQ